MIVVPDQAARILLNLLLNDPNTWIHLYVAPVTLGPTTTAADLTEASWPDYAPAPVVAWSDAATSAGYAYSVSDPVVWTRGAGGSAATVYGYWVSNGNPGLLVWVEEWQPGPIPMAAPTDTASITPRFTLRQDPMPG